MKMLFAALLAAAAPAAVPEAELLTTFSSARNDYNLSMDRAERIAVFARSDADFRNARILVAERRGRGWTEPQPMTFTDTSYSDSDPWLTQMGARSTSSLTGRSPPAGRPRATWTSGGRSGPPPAGRRPSISGLR